jgi:hypothetical protein
MTVGEGPYCLDILKTRVGEGEFNYMIYTKGLSEGGLEEQKSTKRLKQREQRTAKGTEKLNYKLSTSWVIKVCEELFALCRRRRRSAFSLAF